MPTRFTMLLSCPPRPRCSLRDVVIWLALVAFLVTTGGVPMHAAPQWGGGNAFPCQGHRCGCRTAEQCWKQCCCYTPQQKSAWARQRGITPPAAKARSCCAVRLAKSGARNCCDSAPTSDRGLMALAAPGCRGAALEWLSLGAVMVDFEFVSAPRDLLATGHVPLCDEASASTSLLPAVPPPIV